MPLHVYFQRLGASEGTGATPSNFHRRGSAEIMGCASLSKYARENIEPPAVWVTGQRVRARKSLDALYF